MGNLSDREIVEKDMKNLYLGNLNTVEFDLTLPLTGEYGSHIAWESAHEGLLKSDGTVHRPSFGMGNRMVELTGIFTHGEVREKRVYEVTILQQKKDLKIGKVYDISRQVKVNEDFYLPEVIPVETEDGDRIMYGVSWDGGRKHCISHLGKTSIKGQVRGTDREPRALITIVECPVIQYMDRVPALISMAEPGAQTRVILQGKSVFLEAQERMHQVLLGMDEDQMLYNFRVAAGLDVKGAPQMIGWDGPDSQLRGHTTGHYLSALALCFHATGDERIFRKGEYMVEELKKCQDGFFRTGRAREGFLSGYSEEQFDLLEVYTTYPTIWAPYYTLHKILAGLLDCWRFAGLKTALEIGDKLGDWIYNRLIRLTKEQRDKMWGMYIAGEIGGINESLASLYEQTGKENHLKAAKMFDNEKLFLPMEMEVDALSGLHANQHIPQVVGAMRIFQVTGEGSYYKIGKYFWNAVTKWHTYSIGGTGEAEMFHPAKEIGGRLTKSTAESCASYNMLKLTGQLYQYEKDAGLMDYYERTLFNHVVASADKDLTGANTYFMPLEPASQRTFEDENSCCHGTGLESQSKYIDSIYYRGKDELYVNLFIPSRVEWKEKGLSVELKTEMAHPEKVSLVIDSLADSNIDLRVRKPAWHEGDYHIYINGEPGADCTEENRYIRIPQPTGGGKTQIDILFHCTFRIEETPDHPEIVSLFYGPYILAALSEKKEMLTLPGDAKHIQEIAERQEDGLVFRIGGVTWLPFCMVDKENYHLYLVQN